MTTTTTENRQRQEKGGLELRTCSDGVDGFGRPWRQRMREERLPVRQPRSTVRYVCMCVCVWNWLVGCCRSPLVMTGAGVQLLQPCATRDDFLHRLSTEQHEEMMLDASAGTTLLSLWRRQAKTGLTRRSLWTATERRASRSAKRCTSSHRPGARSARAPTSNSPSCYRSASPFHPIPISSPTVRRAYEPTVLRRIASSSLATQLPVRYPPSCRPPNSTSTCFPPRMKMIFPRSHWRPAAGKGIHKRRLQSNYSPAVATDHVEATG